MIEPEGSEIKCSRDECFELIGYEPEDVRLKRGRETGGHGKETSSRGGQERVISVWHVWRWRE
jgi:hypothetical protein